MVKDNVSCEVVDPIADKDLTQTYEPRQIYLNDMESVYYSDLIFAEVMLDRPYVGTAMELQEAHILNKDIILVTNKDHYFLDYIINAGTQTKRAKTRDFKQALNLLQKWRY